MILIKGNLACNFQCAYCYQNPVRETKEAYRKYNLDAIEKAVRKEYARTKSRVVIHGGEPLTYPKQDFKRLLKLSYELCKHSAIQTNGYLIDEDFIEMFKKYKTSVGLSIDGPYPCNELRGFGSKEDRKKQTKIILRNLERLLQNKINTSVIIVLHKKNFIGERRELLKQFILYLESKKIAGRLNPCCSGIKEIDLTPRELAEGYLDILDFMIENNISGWSPYRDIINSLKGEKDVVCVFQECDPYYTPSATSILHDGSLGVCLRLYIDDGHIYLRDKRQLNVRSQVLKETDCKGCKYWNNCYGGCPGMAVDFDWRNKDRYCEAYKILFARIEKMLKFLNIKKCKKEISKKYSSIEHLDGNVRHLDSDFAKRHSDGMEHLDGDIRHLDSNIQPHSDHADGIEHLDGEIKHLDSG